LTGTEISKEAADVVLLDDNFHTIVQAIEGGRLIYANITKFIVYLLACNSAEIWTVLFAVIFNVPIPFSAINILWANIIADVPPSMSLGCEPPEVDLLKRKPRRRNDPVLSVRKWILLICEGFLLSAITLSVYIFHYLQKTSDLDILPLRSESFFVLTSLQLCLAFLSRSTCASVFRIGICGNRYLVGAVILSFTLLVTGHYLPGLNWLLELRPITGRTWIILGYSVIILVFVTEVLKAILRYRK